MSKNIDRHKPKSIYPLNHNDQKKRLAIKQSKQWELFVPIEWFRTAHLDDINIRLAFSKYGIAIMDYEQVVDEREVQLNLLQTNLLIRLSCSQQWVNQPFLQQVCIGFNVKFYTSTDMVACQLIL